MSSVFKHGLGWVFMLGCFVVASALDAGEATDRMLFADGLFSRGLYEMAAQEYRMLVQTPPQGFLVDVALFRLAECARQQGDKKEAERTYRQLIEGYPDSEYRFRAAFRRAELFVAAEQYAEAEPLFRALLGDDSPDEMKASAHYYHGYVLEKQLRTLLAQAAYRAVLKEYPDSEYEPYAILALARLLLEQDGTNVEARELLRVGALRKQPNRVAAEALFLLGDLAFTEEDYAAATDAYQQLSHNYPEDRRAKEAALQAGWSTFRAGDPDQAMVMANQALDRRADALRVDWQYLLANILRQKNLFIQSLEMYGILLQDSPAHRVADASQYERLLLLFQVERFARVIDQGKSWIPPDEMAEDVGWLMAQSYEATGELALAAETWTRQLDAWPASERAPEVGLRLARLYQEQGNLAGSISVCLRVAEQYPDAGEGVGALFFAATSMIAVDRVTDAIFSFDKILTRYPNFERREEVLFQKGLSELRNGEPAAAAESLSQLLAEMPDGTRAAESRFWMGIIREKMGRREEAAEIWEFTLASSPTPELTSKLHFYLAAVYHALGRFDDALDAVHAVLPTPLRGNLSEALLEWATRYALDQNDVERGMVGARVLVENAKLSSSRQIGLYLGGLAAQRAGMNAEASGAFEKAVAEEAATAEGVKAWLALGDLAMQRDDVDSAEQAYQEVALGAADDVLLSVRARSYFGMGRVAEARKDWEEAGRRYMSVGILFDDPILAPKALYRAAQAFQQLGKTKEYNKAMTELQQRYPENEWATEGTTSGDTL